MKTEEVSMADSGSLKEESGRTFDHKYQKIKSQGLKMFFLFIFTLNYTTSLEIQFNE